MLVISTICGLIGLWAINYERIATMFPSLEVPPLPEWVWGWIDRFLIPFGYGHIAVWAVGVLIHGS